MGVSQWISVDYRSGRIQSLDKGLCSGLIYLLREVLGSDRADLVWFGLA